MPHRKIIRGLLLSLSIATLAACSSGEEKPMQSSKSDAPMPPITEMDAAMNKPAPQPLPLSQSDTLTPAMPAATVADATTAATSSAAPGSVEARMEKLEQSVGSLRSDYDRIMPAFASLNTTNERIQALLDEIEKETGKRPVLVDAPTKPAEPAPSLPKKEPTVTEKPTEPTKPEAATVTKPAAPATEPAPAASTNMANSITGVRIGEHDSKTRLVFDLTGKDKPEFKYDLDNAEKLLVVDMPTSSWSGSMTSSKPANSQMIDSWSSQKGTSGGTSVAIQLKKGARILSTQYLKAEGKDPARLVMDIGAAN